MGTRALRIFGTWPNRKRRNFPRASATQEAMLAKIMDYYKDNKDAAGVRKWAKRIDRGDFQVSSKYAAKVKLLVLTMQFENVEKSI